MFSAGLNRPAATGQANPLNGIDGFYINPNSENVDAAVDLALYLSRSARGLYFLDGSTLSTHILYSRLLRILVLYSFRSPCTPVVS